MAESEEIKGVSYVDILKTELSQVSRTWDDQIQYIGKLQLLREKLGHPQNLKVEYEALMPRKKPTATFKLTGTKSGRIYYYRESWVVKFSPVDKKDDPWYDVYEEYNVLESLYKQGVVCTPKPLHRSTEAEVEVVGTKFIVMSYIEGARYQNVSEIPQEKRKTVFTSVMKTLASLHKHRWTTEKMRENREFTTAQCFWDAEICCWERNFKGESLVQRSNSEPDLVSECNQILVSPLIDVDSDDPHTEDDKIQSPGDISEEQQSVTSGDRDGIKSPSSLQMTAFVNKMMTTKRPSAGKIGIIHGDINISNFVFDQKGFVNAVVGWKFGKRNGDPMIDVAYFCMMFSRPEDQGLDYRPLNSLPLLYGNPGQIEESIIDEYKSQISSYTFSKSRFWFAKAVCCMRLLAIMKVATKDEFESHKSGWHESIKEHKHLTMEWLAKAGEDFYRKASLASDANSL